MLRVIIKTNREARVVEVWRANGHTEGTIWVYLSWARRFEQSHPGGEAATRLTRAEVEAFATIYAERRGSLLVDTVRRARVALRAWSRGLRRCGESVPEWAPVPVPVEPRPLLAEFRAFRLRHAGVARSTVRADLRAMSKFLDVVLPDHDGASRIELTLEQIDDYVTSLGSRWSRKTTATFCSSLRPFLRFLHQKGHLPHDLARSVAAPVVRLGERPPRGLPWGDVQRLLQAVDTSRRAGSRDYAVLLMMAMYGMGAAEVLHLRLEDLDWRANSVKVFRPKTQVEYLLPLLPEVARALVAYLQSGRPAKVTSRHVFIAAQEPHGPMSGSALRHMIAKHGAAAGLTTRLGGHVLRHSHARRQMELGASMKTIGDILGHRDPASTSAYIRVPTRRLRAIALPVPKR